MMKVLVTDGDERAALAVTRSLGQRGIEVVVGAVKTPSLAGVSRYCCEAFAYPSPLDDPEGFLSALLNVVTGKNIGVLLPITDLSTSIIGAARSRFEPHVKLPLPAMAAYDRLSDKYELMKLAGTVGVPIPETVFVPAGGLTPALLGQVRRYPVVVKPGRSVVHMGGITRKTSVHHVKTEAELRALYKQVDYLQDPSLIQQRVEGEGQGIFALMNQGTPVATFAHRRLREKPPSGGVSVLRESMAVPKRMGDYGLRLLETVGWHGVAMVEFKVDQSSNVPMLMEVNGRWWGSLQLAIDAGIDFPFLLYQMAAGNTGQMGGTRHRIGTQSRWFLGDLDHLLLRLTRSSEQLNLPPGSPGRLRLVSDFCRFWGRDLHYEVERWHDVWPALYEWGCYIRALLPLTDRQWAIVGAPFRLGQALVQWMVSLPAKLLAAKEFYRRPAPGNIRLIVVACTGNICRSPLAEAYLKAECAKRLLSIAVMSVGLDTSPGHPANPSAQVVGSRHGLVLDRHRTAMFTRSIGEAADLILVMDLEHRAMLLDQYPAGHSKVVMLGYFDRLFYEISDPFGKSESRFEQCFAQITRSCDRVLEWLGPR